MIPSIVIILSLILDGIASLFSPYLPNTLSLFTTFFTLVSIFIICPFYRKDEKKYLIIVFILGIIYDLLYTNLLFFNAVLFVIIGLISLYINKNFEITYLKIILYIALIIVTYESLTGIILFIYNIVPVTIPKVIYKITHSLLLNIIYAEIIHFIIKKIPKKYKNISIN